MATNNERPSILSRKSASETERTPAHGDMPRVSDTLVNMTGAPDADYHPEALANAVADNEAGTIPDDEIGGIEPLERKK
ncbi:hypothetical protein ACFOEZ_18035 [Tianweitania populi]|uniref:Uncharacterized protein n=1 Tax=Tianweitania populi TaxID=1607949 RepID=A0A8J3GKE7_9HYPH|nr:hypothetical protein [Tianweitania populi]GHD13928.1 hypothetical protein GCM10016234_18830 [Tianweitania populi]